MGDVQKTQLQFSEIKKYYVWDEKTQEGININLDNVEENYWTEDKAI